MLIKLQLYVPLLIYREMLNYMIVLWEVKMNCTGCDNEMRACVCVLITFSIQLIGFLPYWFIYSNCAVLVMVSHLVAVQIFYPLA